MDDSSEKWGGSLLLRVLELVPPLRIALNPHADAHRRAPEIRPAVFADDDLAAVPSEQIGPPLIGVLLPINSVK